MSIAAQNVQDVDREFDQRLGDQYVYGGDYAPDPNTGQGDDCSYEVSWVVRGYLYGINGFDWGTHPVSTESWPYTYDSSAPNGGYAAAPGTVGPYGTIAIAGPNDQPADSALLICIMHQGGGEDSHMNCLTGPAITPSACSAPAGKIMESNGDAGTSTNGTGGTPADSNIWTDWWYLPGPIEGDVAAPPPAPAGGRTYAVQSGDTLDGIAQKFSVTEGALLAANPAITNPNAIYAGQVLTIPSN